MNSIYFTIFGLVFLLLLMSIYFPQKRFKSLENSIYNYLIGVSLFSTVIEIVCFLIVIYHEKSSIYNYSIKMLFSCFILWLYFFTLYFIIVSLKKDQFYKATKIIKYSVIFLFTILTINLFLPIKIIKRGMLLLPVGLSVNVIYIMAFISIILIICLLFKNFKYLSNKKYSPLFIILILLIIVVIVQKLFPTILLVNPSFIFITFLMYFTIENPDLKMIEELAKARIISEQSNDEKAKFLYEVNAESNIILNNIEKVHDNVLNLNPSFEIKEEMNNLINILNRARIKAKQSLDISEIDTKYLKAINTKYDIRLLVNSVYLQIKPRINTNVDFRLNIVDNLPNVIYGDSIKLKQILITILDNSVKYTSKGFIELKVNFIVKYDLCRLLFTIEDSGQGIDIAEINNIMTDHSDINEEDLNYLDDPNLNLKIIRKMINLIGGTMTIESELNKGTSIKINIDQKIAKEEQSNEEKAIEKYSNELKNKQRVAIISTNNDELKVIKKALKKFDINTETFIETLPCLTNIRNNICYDVIFIDENMDKIDAESFLYKVKMVEGYKTRIMVITSSKDFNHKKELINKGFNNVITLPINRDEIRNKIIS